MKIQQRLLFIFYSKTDWRKEIEGSEEINGAIYCPLNHIKLLRICKTLLLQLKERRQHPMDSVGTMQQ